MPNVQLQAVADFHCRPTEAEITSMLAESQEYDDPSMTDDAVRRSIEVAERWLDNITKVINETFVFHGQTNDDSITVRYVEGEDLGWGCDNPGPSPFNNIYYEGPTLYAFVKGKVHIRPTKEDYRIGLNFCTPAVDKDGKPDGYKVMLRVPELRFFIAFQFADV